MIDIRLTLSDEGKLTFVCQNNYKAANIDANAGKGIGLSNVRKRLNLLYHDAHELEIQQTDFMYKVTLEMVLNETNMNCIIIEDQPPAQRILKNT